MNGRKGQQLTFTALFVLFIFFLALTLFFDELLVNPRLADERHEHLQREVDRATRTIASTGYPADWEVDDVERAGLLSDGALDEQKVDRLKGISYGRSKDHLGITDEYLLIIETPGSEQVIGEYGTEEELLDSGPAYLATRTRVVPHGDGIAVLTMHVYREVP